MNQQDMAEANTLELKTYFQELLDEESEHGDIGATGFKVVYDQLMDSQKDKLREVSGEKFDSLCESGSIISIGIPYKDPTIDYINDKQKGDPDYQLWNEYAKEYHRIYQVLNRMSVAIASRFNGIPLKSTIGGIIGEIDHVHDYFPMVISHRVVAENSGIGWRGKNQLVIHEKFSCAIRFSSVIISIPVMHGEKMESKCGDCTACEDACGFIRFREKLPDYRESCRRYILFLKSKGIEKSICGKCIKACYRSSKFRMRFSL
ncbi:MAG: epoxyqueuosine reductase [Candidatus Thorarchaeota archaeon]|nr:MAG: epoxyqueuosine reductase [Candidatus Thorarchaeota archaeon]